MSTLRRCFGTLAAAAVGLTAGLIAPAPAVAAPPSQGDLLVLLDASGSMEEPAGGGEKASKMQAARKAVHEVADALPDDARVGLRAYGPPATGGGCKASKLLRPIGALDRDALKSTVDDLPTGGDTPLAYSLKKAAKDFSGERPRTILLISDGEESCGGDPAKVAKEIADAGVNLQIDVVGFRVDSKARDQLAAIAKAGKGRYFDAQDGAALASRMKRASTHAIRGFRAAGTPVNGSTDGRNPPLLKPGLYRDQMPPNRGSEKPIKYYTVEMPKGATLYFSAVTSWSGPLNREVHVELGAKVTTAEKGYHCDSDVWYAEYPGGGVASVGAQVRVPYEPDAKQGECGAAGTYLIEVNNDDDVSRTGVAPLEIAVVVEPGAATGGLPGPYEGSDVVRPTVKSEPQSVTGSGSYNDAPVLKDGVYNDVLRPGEEVFYRVPLNWGQRLAYEVTLPKLEPDRLEMLGEDSVQVASTVEDPVRSRAVQPGSSRNVYYRGERMLANGSTAPVRYRNREASERTTSATSLPGYYYVWLRMDAEVADPYFEVPVTLKVEVTGKVTGKPKYQDPTNLGSPDEQLEVELTSGDGTKKPAKAPGGGVLPTALLWVGAGVGALMFLGGGGFLAVRLLRN